VVEVSAGSLPVLSQESGVSQTGEQNGARAEMSAVSSDRVDRGFKASEANKASVGAGLKKYGTRAAWETIDELAANGTDTACDTDVTLRGPAGFKPFVRNLRGPCRTSI
jgi:hypothetical protein